MKAIRGTPDADYLDFGELKLTAVTSVFGEGGDDFVQSPNPLSGITYDGGDGIDTIRVAGNWPSVVDLAGMRLESLVLGPTEEHGNWASTSAAIFTSTLRNFENVVATWANDRLYGDDRGNYLEGGAGDDYLDGVRGNDHLVGGAGVDTLGYWGAPSGVYVDLQQGRAFIPEINEVDLVSEVENVDATNFDDVVFGSMEDNRLFGRDGNDILFGRGGDDALSADSGDDILIGGEGSDTLNGGKGLDRMQGGPGDDVYMVDQTGDELVELAEAGVDTVRIATSSYVLPDHIENLELQGTAWLHGIGNRLNNVLVGNDAPNALFGSDGNDTLDGGAESDGVFGGNGDDSLHGGGGPDKVYGGDGNDRLDGGDGNDILTGKTGSDAFLFSGNHGIDSIRDFDITTDHLEIAGGFWAVEMLDGTFDGVLDYRDANVFYGVPEKSDVYQPNYDGPPDDADAYGINIITGGGIIHLDHVSVLTTNAIWALS
jgi:Ca2+-binding RTX toxin-like protein